MVYQYEIEPMPGNSVRDVGDNSGKWLIRRYGVAESVKDEKNSKILATYLSYNEAQVLVSRQVQKMNDQPK